MMYFPSVISYLLIDVVIVVVIVVARYGDVVDHVAGRGNWHFFKVTS